MEPRTPPRRPDGDGSAAVAAGRAAAPPVRAAGLAVAAALVANLVVRAIFAVINAQTYLSVTDYSAGAIGAAELDRRTAAATEWEAVSLPLAVVATAGTLAALIFWLWCARANADSSRPGRHRLSRGWVIGAWFTPIVSLWYPLVLVDDVVRASDPATPPTSARLPASASTRAVIGWWAAFLTGTALLSVASVSGLVARLSLDSGAAVAAMVAEIASGLCYTVAAALLIVIVGRVVRWQIGWSPTTPTAASAAAAPQRPPLAERLSGRMRVAIAVAAGLTVGTAIAVPIVGLDRGDTPDTTVSASAAAPTWGPRPNSLVPPQNPYWQAAVSTHRNAAFDVPPEWQVKAPGWLAGYDVDQLGVTVRSLGPAEYTDGACGGASRSAFAGVTGSSVPNLTAAAADAAHTWALGMFTRGTADPVRLGAATALTVNGRPAQLVTATVPDTTCPDGRSGIVHAVALAGARGESVIFVVGADQGIPGAVGDSEMRQMIMSVRPAGLTATQCQREGIVGTWC